MTRVNSWNVFLLLVLIFDSILWSNGPFSLAHAEPSLSHQAIYSKFLEKLGYSQADWQAALEQQTPCDPFLKGGPYELVRELATHCQVETHGVADEAHHMPSREAIHPDKGSGKTIYLHKNIGPSILMSREDHSKTASYGSWETSDIYREHQRQLIENGKFSEAFENDIKDIQDKFAHKYDEGIEQTILYKEFLETLMGSSN